MSVPPLSPIAALIAALAALATGQDGGPARDIVARVGDGQITRTEYEAHLAHFALQEAKLPAELGPRSRRHAFVKLLEDEVLLQAALQLGLHEEVPMRDEIATAYRLNETSAKVDRSTITEAELQAYHAQHPGLFSERTRVLVKMLSFPAELAESELKEQVRRLRLKPSALEAPWIDLNWRLRGETLIDSLDQSRTESVFELTKGQVSKPIKDPAGNSYLFWVQDREEGKPRPLPVVRQEVLERVYAHRCAKLEAEVLARLRAEDPGRADEVLWFAAAMKNQTVREPAVRAKLIAAYLKQRRLERGPAIAALRGQITIEVLLRDP